MSNKSSQPRNRCGNLLTIIILVVGILILLGLAVVSLGLSMRSTTKHGFAAEAAALAAATEISRVIINDPYFGYVSLVDAPPVESNLNAQDGQPLPVTGINSIIAAARAQLIVAEKLGSDYMIRLARFEGEQARRAAAGLEEEIEYALSPSGNKNLRDASGALISPYGKAKMAFIANTCPDANPKEQREFLENLRFRITLGWLKNAGSTEISIPGEEFCPQEQRRQGKYKPAVQLPYAGEKFCLGAIGPRPALLSGEFHEPDGEHLSTIVRVEVKTPISLNQLKSKVDAVAMAQPGAQTAATPPGSLVIDLGYCKPIGIDTLRDLLAGASYGSSAEIRSAAGGDVPGFNSTLRSSAVRTGESRLSTEDLLGLAISDWLRTAHCQVKLDSLFNAFDTSLTDSDSSNRFCRFDIGSDGTVYVTRSRQSPFPPQQVRENQIYSYVPAALAKSLSGVTVFDHVHRLGNTNGGQHGGQVAEAESVNWSELPEYEGSCDKATTMGRGSKHLGIEANGAESFISPGGIQTTSASFITKSGTQLKQQPRRTYLSGGLAVLIQITAPAKNVY